jgi:hypothetical protein
MNTEHYQDELKEINGFLVHITTYKIGDEYFCHITNADPGATIARAAGKTEDEARQTGNAKSKGKTCEDGVKNYCYHL